MEKKLCYRVPSYYLKFACKGGDCRHTCCEGWNVSVSLDEYFKLLSVDCCIELKEKIDHSLQIALHPSVERYALFSPNYYGDCPLRDETNGYCRLQEECGESLLPSICRLYPRSFIHPKDQLACISNSCEKMVELLLSNELPITFTKQVLCFPEGKINEDVRYPKNLVSIKDECIELLSNRSKTLPFRFLDLSVYINQLLDISNQEVLSLNTFGESCESIMSVWHFEWDIIHDIAKKSPSMVDTFKILEDLFPLSLNNPERIIESEYHLYEQKQQDFYQKYPKWDIYLEKLLINHMLYIDFPFVNYQNNKDIASAYLILVETFSFLKFIVISSFSNNTTITDIVDIIGETFRLIEHSSFDKNVLIFLSLSNICTFNQMKPFLLL